MNHTNYTAQFVGNHMALVCECGKQINTSNPSAITLHRIEEMLLGGPANVTMLEHVPMDNDDGPIR